MIFFFCVVSLFLSTLSLRRATRQHSKPDSGRIHFYPRSPCGERPHGCYSLRHSAQFLSTLSLRRATILFFQYFLAKFEFLSTLSLRRATSSIDDLEPSTTHFYPRSPCGERRRCFSASQSHFEFLSTLSLRRATGYTVNFHAKARFLSTLSLRRATREPTALRTPHQNFYPRSPCGERRRPQMSSRPHNTISIHALLAESDSTFSLPLVLISLFLSTLSLRRATRTGQSVSIRASYFYPRSPCGERLGLDGRFKL